MATASGTATNYLDFLDRLRLFASTNATLVGLGQQWAVERWAGGNELIMRGPGLTGTEAIRAGLRGYFDTPSDYYNLEARGMHGFLAGSAFDAQPGVSRPCFLPLWNSSIPYWFVGNGQRLIAVAKVSTVYEILYLGKILPYGQPTHYPAPILIAAGTGVQATRWSATDSQHSNLTRPRTSGSNLSCGVFNGAGNTWVDYSTESNSTLNVYPWPYCWHSNSPQSEAMTYIDVNPDGSYTLEPIRLIQEAPGVNLLGELDGVAFVTGQGNASENTITIGGDTWLVVQNVHRTTRDAYCAVKLA
jgi:hypothetical protein